MENLPGFNLVIERLLISGATAFGVGETQPSSFNLVIERLLISGYVNGTYTGIELVVSISLSSGFSFQGL